MSVIGNGVSLRGIFFEDFQLPFNLAAGITKADQGKAVTLDASAANQVKLAGDGDPIVGRLIVVENRQVEGVIVGTVAFKFADALPYESAPSVGDTVVGSATAGKVKAAAATDHTANVVVEVDTANGFCTVLKL